MAGRRILFYCHNLYGLGHIRRSTRLASACLDRGATCAVVTGCKSLGALSWDPRIVLFDLAPLAVGEDQQFFEAGHPERTDVIARRTAKIEEVMADFSPDVFVVDYLPGGIGGELLPLGADPSPVPQSCQVVLGVPYTKRISRPAAPPRNPRVRRWADRFDAVLAYTDPAWEDPLSPLEPGGLPGNRGFSGFITGVPAKTRAENQRVVILAGGGREAIEMAPLLRESLERLVAETGISVRCVVGPLGDFESVREILSPFATVVPSGEVEEAVEGASVIISRCGYNSAYTLLRSDAPIVFMPQISPCYEQLDRAESLRPLDRVLVVRENDEGASDKLRSAVEKSLAEPHRARELPFAVDGDRVAAEWLLSLGPSVK